MKRFIIAVLILIFMSFLIMAENIGNVSSSVSEIKSNNDILLKCSNMAGESTQVTGINENNVIQDFNFGIFTKWGIVIAVFGTIIPPLLMNAGFPHTGLGLGSIISSVELPVSVMMAFFILGETVIFSQWVGIVLILIAIVIMNIQFKKK